MKNLKSLIILAIFCVGFTYNSNAQAYYTVNVVNNNTNSCVWTIEGFKSGVSVWSFPAWTGGGVNSYTCGQYGGVDDIDQIKLTIGSRCTVITFTQSSGWSGTQAEICTPTCGAGSVTCSASTPTPSSCPFSTTTEIIHINIQ